MSAIAAMIKKNPLLLERRYDEIAPLLLLSLLVVPPLDEPPEAEEVFDPLPFLLEVELPWLLAVEEEEEVVAAARVASRSVTKRNSWEFGSTIIR